MKLFDEAFVLVIFVLGQITVGVRAQKNSGVDQKLDSSIDVVTSSMFQLVIHPTPTKMNSEAIEKVTNSMENVILISSFRSSGFASLNSIRIRVEEFEFNENYGTEGHYASVIDFGVEAIFDDSSVSRSEFEVNNLVVRTFSHPSTKTSFLGLLTLTGDPVLEDVRNIDLFLIDGDPNGQTDESDRLKGLSEVDVILIIGSSFILIGVFLIVAIQYRKDGYEDVQEQKSFRRTNDIVYGCNPSNEKVDLRLKDEQRGQISTAEMMPSTENIFASKSVESSIDSQSEFVASIANDSSAVSIASSSSGSSNSTSASSIFTSEEETTVDTLSEASNGGASRSENDSRSEPNEERNEEVSREKSRNDLGLALKKLSASHSYNAWKRKRLAFSSSASAPTILEEPTRESKSERATSMNERPVISARSATGSVQTFEHNSSEDEKGSVSLLQIPQKSFGPNGVVVVSLFDEFHKSWVESERKAEEDYESDDNLFDVGLCVDETQKSKSVSVSQWMNSIRVVQSTSETQSSVEHSSIEPESHTIRNSLDFSLEGSLAASVVDP